MVIAIFCVLRSLYTANLFWWCELSRGTGGGVAQLAMIWGSSEGVLSAQAQGETHGGVLNWGFAAVKNVKLYR